MPLCKSTCDQALDKECRRNQLHLVCLYSLGNPTGFFVHITRSSEDEDLYSRFVVRFCFCCYRGSDGRTGRSKSDQTAEQWLGQDSCVGLQQLGRFLLLCFSSTSAYQCFQNNGGCTHATADSAMQVANLMISLGLKDVGYQYLNIDDCWHSKSRNSSGFLVPDPSKWPQGMKPVVDKIHGMGLKFGLYGDAGTMTCAGYPGSQGHEVQDAKTIASWGVDYWKHDACYTPCITGGVPQTCWDSRSPTQKYYSTMRDALAGAGRPILFSMCQWGRDSVWTWGT
jgi:hypothetical protein